MRQLINFIRRYPITITYIALIVCINTLFIYLPMFTVINTLISPMDFFVGVIYVARDFAQQEIKKYIFIPMLIACVLTFVIADRDISIASGSAFTVGEIIDWAIFTYTKKPFSERILLSSVISCPIDSYIFLAIIHQLNTLGFLILTCSKILGALAVWYLWYFRDKKISHTVQNRPTSKIVS